MSDEHSALEAGAAERHLEILGALHPEDDPALPPGTQTLLLLGPREPGFWAHVTAQPEFADHAPDPLDRWSHRVIGGWAQELGATAVFPFGGPPHLPFLRWAVETRRAHVSPVGLLVHDHAGLMVSYRGALALSERIPLPAPPPAPCSSCARKPCLSACPAGALTAQGYDVPACKAYLDTAPGQDCRAQGCAVRRACPISAGYGRVAEQSAYHMSRFHAPA